MNFFEQVAKVNPDAAYPSGHKAAIIGMAMREETLVFVLSRDIIVMEIMKRDGMHQDDADDWFDFNIQSTVLGKNTPYYVDEV